MTTIVAAVTRDATRTAARGASGVSSTVRRKAVAAGEAGVASVGLVVPKARADREAPADPAVAAEASWALA